MTPQYGSLLSGGIIHILGFGLTSGLSDVTSNDVASIDDRRLTDLLDGYSFVEEGMNNNGRSYSTMQQEIRTAIYNDEIRRYQSLDR